MIFTALAKPVLAHDAISALTGGAATAEPTEHPPASMQLGLSAFVVYSTWAAFQGKDYAFGPYLSPFYSPVLWGDPAHAWFGERPGWWPGGLLYSPALLSLWVPALFRCTCYYYRGAYYKAFWMDPPSCTVGEPRKSYWGESRWPLLTHSS